MRLRHVVASLVILLAAANLDCRLGSGSDAGRVRCGGGTCDLDTTHCCVTQPNASTARSLCGTDVCAGLAVHCDEPADCGDGSVCCDVGSEFRCQSSCPDSDTVCWDDRDCPANFECGEGKAAPAPVVGYYSDVGYYMHCQERI
jgi:hypothetical protein